MSLSAGAHIGRTVRVASHSGLRFSSPWHRRPLGRFFSADAASHPSNKVQVYISQSHDPFINLSIEHFLLQKSPPDSVVLFLYTNRPCVVIGRNQNPWVEVNLGLLSDGPNDTTRPCLVRRRSGGGTVFHDMGNANFSVLCPPADFDRDKHAEMVVRALDSLGVDGTPRVNERHDIVVDVAEDSTFKISGSAYKLTRTRSLHHGTCLLNSPNLATIGSFLRSPAAPYIKARGVASVRSPIRNVGVHEPRAFDDAVMQQFEHMYGEANDVTAEGNTVTAEEALAIPEIRKGVEELKSLDWLYTQTPQFAFSTHPTAEDPRSRPPLSASLPSDFALAMTVRHGQVTEVSDPTIDGPASPDLQTALKSVVLHQIGDWRAQVGASAESVGSWLNGLFGVGGSGPSNKP